MHAPRGQKFGITFLGDLTSVVVDTLKEFAAVEPNYKMLLCDGIAKGVVTNLKSSTDVSPLSFVTSACTYEPRVPICRNSPTPSSPSRRRRTRPAASRSRTRSTRPSTPPSLPTAGACDHVEQSCAKTLMWQSGGCTERDKGLDPTFKQPPKVAEQLKFCKGSLVAQWAGRLINPSRGSP